jgi:hypothetical protein
MRSKQIVSRLGGMAALGSLAFFAVIPAAAADTANASANAATVAPGGNLLVTSGTETATNPGGSATDVEGGSPALSILGGQAYVTAGALQQTAVANGSGQSSACAGLLGNGAAIQVGQQPLCDLTTQNGESGGVTLGPPGGPALVNATAIVETCSDSSTGSPTASAELVGLSLGGNAIPIPNPTTPNDFIIPGLLEANVQSVSNGEISATALEIVPLGISIGNVTCGPNAVTGASSVLPAKSIPIAIGTGAAAAGVALIVVRRRRGRAVSAS